MRHERNFAAAGEPRAADRADDPGAVVSATDGLAAQSAPTPSALAAYQRDLFERTILFLDTLRQRADDMLEHERAGKPPLLDFSYELLLDARNFERPANYALLRITRVSEVCVEDASIRPSPR